MQTQINSVKQHYTADERSWMPESDKQALQMLQIIKRLRGVTRMGIREKSHHRPTRPKIGV